MNIIGVRKYEADPREQITFSFRRSRPNLPVSLSVDGGEFLPMVNEFALQVPADKGTQRRVVIMIVGEDNDLCNLTISGENGPPDQDALVVMNTPVCSARYRFTVP